MKGLSPQSITSNKKKDTIRDSPTISEFDTVRVSQAEKKFSRPTGEIETEVFYSPAKKKDKFRLSQNFK